MGIRLMDGTTSIGVFLYLRNNEEYISKFLLERLEVIEQRYKDSVEFSYYVFENDSKDKTKELMAGFMEGRKGLYMSKDLRLSGIFKGTSYQRIERMCLVRNMLLDAVRPMLSQHQWCLFIDSDIFFEEDVLEKMLHRKDLHEAIMLTCNTSEIHKNDGQNVPVVDGVPYVTQNHYYDVFPYITKCGVNTYPYCLYKECVSNQCQKFQKEMKDLGKGGCLFDQKDTVKVRSAWGGVVLIRSEGFASRVVRWNPLRILNSQSLCEHVYFCDVLHARTEKDILVLGDVMCWKIEQDQVAAPLCVSMTSIPSRLESLVPRIDRLLGCKQNKRIHRVFVSIPRSYRRFPDWDGDIPEDLLMFSKRDPRFVLVRPETDDGPATKFLGAIDEIPSNSWVFICDDDQDYQWDNIIQSAFLDHVVHGEDAWIWQNGATEEMEHGICGPIAGFKGIFVHATVLSLLKSYERHDAMYCIDDQWFLMFATLGKHPIHDTKLDRVKIFGNEKENTGAGDNAFDSLYIEKPRGHILRSFIAENLDRLMELEDMSWMLWNVVRKTKKHCSSTRNIVLPLYKCSLDSMVTTLIEEVAPRVVGEETYVDADHIYHFKLGRQFSELPKRVQMAIQRFSANRKCHIHEDTGTLGIENPDVWEILTNGKD